MKNRIKPNANNILRWNYIEPMWRHPKIALRWLFTRPKMIWQRATRGLCEEDLSYFDQTMYDLLIENIYLLREKYEPYAEDGDWAPVCFNSYKDWITWSDGMLENLRKLASEYDSDNEYAEDFYFFSEHPELECGNVKRNYIDRTFEILTERERLRKFVFTEYAEKIEKLH